MNNHQFKLILLAGTFFVGLTCLPLVALGADATMAISPPVGTHRVNDDVTLRILISSDNRLVKTVRAVLKYDTDYLTVTHVIKDGSPITSWDEPFVDPVLGEISFGGWLSKPKALNKDVVLTLRVRPERIGTAEFYFSEGEINEFSTTSLNILTGFSSAKFRIVPEELNVEEVGASGSDVSLSAAPLGEVLGVATVTPTLFLTSETHPDQDAWYSASSSAFLLAFPHETEEIRLGLDKRAEGMPSVRYAPPVYEKTITNLEEGVWYLHASIDGPHGTEVVHHRLQVDRIRPTDATLEEIPPNDNADPTRTFLVGAKDTLSGIASYAFSVDGGPVVVWQDDGTHRYSFRANAQGEHVLRMFATDRAGNNSAGVEASFEVGYLPAPVLVLSSMAPREGEEQTVHITATPNGEVELVTARAGEQAITEKVKTDSSGSAIFESKISLTLGEYKMWGTAHDERGAVSRQSSEISFAVSPSIWGVLSRHPGVPIALLTVLLLLFLLRRVLSGLREELNEHPDSEGQGVAPITQGSAKAVVQESYAYPEQVILRKAE